MAQPVSFMRSLTESALVGWVARRWRAGEPLRRSRCLSPTHFSLSRGEELYREAARVSCKALGVGATDPPIEQEPIAHPRP